MTKLQIRKTNRVVPESPFLTACKERDGLLGNIEMNHYTNVESILTDSGYYTDPGSNLKRSNVVHAEDGDWYGIVEALNKPGVFDKLFKHFKK